MSAPKDPVRYAEYIRRQSEAKKGERNPNYGKHLSEETRRKISEANKGKPLSEEARRRLLEANKGRPLSEEHRRKISNAMASVMKNQDIRRKISDAMRGNTHSKGDRNGNWKGGISFEPYCPKFNNRFKERVRSFFGYRCAECGEPQNGYKLHVHHVNFNKMSCCDNTPPLFVPLCRSCHARTQKDRDYWEEHFTRMINEYHGGACYFPKEEAAT